MSWTLETIINDTFNKREWNLLSERGSNVCTSVYLQFEYEQDAKVEQSRARQLDIR